MQLHDLPPTPRYVEFDQLLAERGAMRIDTERGPLVDTSAQIGTLKSGQLGYLGLDVYEEEADLLFEERSDQPQQDDMLAFLTCDPSVAITRATPYNIAAWQAGQPVNLMPP